MADESNWQKVDEIYRLALEQVPARRAEFLREACAGDDALRAEVESLLGYDDKAGSFLDPPEDPELAQSTAEGETLAHYRILEKLGQGGMGVVYKARDTRLNRLVAIKMLPRRLMALPERRARFAQEARAASSLNHPNIVTIYDIGEAEGRHFIAMEYVEGSTLDRLTPRKGMRLADVLRYAVQIADALARAHGAGVIHRDLKPGNIMVTPDGQVKIVDFGLAKLTAATTDARNVQQPASETTFTVAEEHLTGPGAAMGTAAYMSPEQARGEELDTRTDLFSFGAVLYEMATGQRAFQGGTKALILDGILNRQPVSTVQLRPDLPPKLEEIINKALDKDLDLRYQHASDMRTDLKRLNRGTSSTTSEAPASSSEPHGEAAPDSVIIAGVIKRHKKAAIGTLTVILVLTGVAWLLQRRASRPPTELTLKRLTLNSSENPVQSGAISPDGKYLAYSDVTGIHVKLLSTAEERLIPRPAGVPASADWLVKSWFPDGAQLLADTWESGGRQSMWIVSVLGQSARELREHAAAFEVSPDATHIAFAPEPASPSFVDVRSSGLYPGSIREIWIMGSQGDNIQKVLALGEGEELSHPHWSPDGKRLAYMTLQCSSDGCRGSIETCDLKGMNRAVVVSDPLLRGGDFRWLPDSRIVYSRQESQNTSEFNLWQIGINGQAGTPADKPRRITQWAASGISFGSGGGIGLVSTSADGRRMIFQKTTSQSQIYVGKLAAGGTRMNAPRRLTNDEADDLPTAWTADSKAVLFTSSRNGIPGMFKQEISQDKGEPLFPGPTDRGGPRLSADGSSILYLEFPKAAGPSTPIHLMRISLSGGVPQFVLEAHGLANHICATAPARLCVLLEASEDQKLWTLTAFDPMRGRGKVLRTMPTDRSAGGGLSPDGSTFALSRNYVAEHHIQLFSLVGGRDREITLKGWVGLNGLDWSPDGKGFYCGSASPLGTTVLYVDLNGNARVVWQFKGARGNVWAIPSPDGRYLAMPNMLTNSNIWMVEGF